jgi:hypothetical protein
VPVLFKTRAGICSVVERSLKNVYFNVCKKYMKKLPSGFPSKQKMHFVLQHCPRGGFFARNNVDFGQASSRRKALLQGRTHGCQIFLCAKYQNGMKSQMTTQYTKWQ